MAASLKQDYAKILRADADLVMISPDSLEEHRKYTLTLFRTPNDENPPGKDFLVFALGMTIPVISNSSDELRINSVRDLSLLIFAAEQEYEVIG